MHHSLVILVLLLCFSSFSIHAKWFAFRRKSGTCRDKSPLCSWSIARVPKFCSKFWNRATCPLSCGRCVPVADCKHPTALGMENRAIRDYQITASSVWSVRHGAANCRLNFKAGGGRTGAWSTRTLNGYQWLQVDFRQRATVAEIITQGRQDYNQWVKSYSVWYSNNGRNFWPYRQNGRTKIFRGNSDRNSIVRQTISPAIVARFIRIRPLTWHGFISMRVEFLGCIKATSEKWFRIYSTGYDQCLTLGYRYRSPFLYLTNCYGRSHIQMWQWTSNGQLRIMRNRQCLTLLPGRDISVYVRRRRSVVSMRPCNSLSSYQKWTCSGNWLKLKSLNRYLIPIKYLNSPNAYITTRSYATRSCKWVNYGNRKSLCGQGVLKTPKPKTPPTRKTLTTTPSPKTNPLLITTLKPPPVPKTPLLSPPPPDTSLPDLTPPVPPIPTTSKLPPPPSNRNVSCGTKGRVGYVVNGTVADAGRWPWQVGIKRCPGCNITCGGALISDEWVATAAHCVFELYPEEIYLEAGEVDQAVKSGNEQSFECKKIVVHEDFAIDAPYDKDIALLKLNKYAVFNDYVRPLCLPDNDTVLTAQDLCTVTGFGQIRQNGPKSSRLLEANVKVVPYNTCVEAYLKLTPPRAVTNNMLCAGFKKGGTDACRGDSGGPLTCFDRDNGRFTLGGIVSWGVGCAKPNQYGVYTNVTAVTTWIKQQLSMH